MNSASVSVSGLGNIDPVCFIQGTHRPVEASSKGRMIREKTDGDGTYADKRNIGVLKLTYTTINITINLTINAPLFLIVWKVIIFTRAKYIIGDFSRGSKRSSFVRIRMGITKRCRLSWLTNSALVYEPNAGGGGGLRGLSQ
jgi:hypothetical protein